MSKVEDRFKKKIKKNSSVITLTHATDLHRI